MSDIAGAPVGIGDVIAGKYRVERVLGEGAMGVVVAALHLDLNERRAVKFMRTSLLGDAVGVERFLREARAAVRLKSEHVAKVHDVGRLADGAPYIVMEYLEGSDLKTILEERERLPVEEAVAYLLQVCEAIAEAHAVGIVHRDLKPANLFSTTGVGGASCIKVLDFGLAKVVSSEAVDMTATAQFLGTPLYMSPEQMRSTRSVDGRSDIWALGAILYRMLTGQVPFPGKRVTEVCMAVATDQPAPPTSLCRDLPLEIDAVVLRCLEKDRDRRFATVAELAAALAPFAPGLRTTFLPGVSGEAWDSVAIGRSIPSTPEQSTQLSPPPDITHSVETTAAHGAMSTVTRHSSPSRIRSGISIAAPLVIGTGILVALWSFPPSRETRGSETALRASGSAPSGGLSPSAPVPSVEPVPMASGGIGGQRPLTETPPSDASLAPRTSSKAPVVTKAPAGGSEDPGIHGPLAGPPRDAARIPRASAGAGAPTAAPAGSVTPSVTPKPSLYRRE